MENLQRTVNVHFMNAHRGRRQIKPGLSPVADLPDGRIPRLSRLMALAIHFDGLIKQGGIYNQADLAELGHVTRARVTQILNLLYLAPDIQEQILHLSVIIQGRDPIPERKIRPLVREINWEKQRKMWVSIYPKPAK